MKPVYWRPKKISGKTTLVIGIVAMLALAGVEIVPQMLAPNYLEEKLAANQLAQVCRQRIREARRTQGLKLNRLFDPTESGLLGTAMTSITSKPASLEAKQLSIHPQFPSAVVQMLRDAGIKNGDTVAVGWTGSFPGLNVALASAIQTLELKPIIIASVTASQYGANEPELTWLDMESSLKQAGVIRFESMAATIGGPSDCGKGMNSDAKDTALAAIDRNGVRYLKSNRLAKSIDARMRFLNKKSGPNQIAAYINVGGGAASCGGEDCVFASGLSVSGPTEVKDDKPIVDCMMQRFSDRGVPVIHLARPRSIAKRYGLTNVHQDWHVGSVVSATTAAPSKAAALTVFALLCLLLRAFVLKDRGNKVVTAVANYLQGRPALRAVGQGEGPQLMA